MSPAYIPGSEAVCTVQPWNNVFFTGLNYVSLCTVDTNWLVFTDWKQSF